MVGGLFVFLFLVFFCLIVAVVVRHLPSNYCCCGFKLNEWLDVNSQHTIKQAAGAQRTLLFLSSSFSSSLFIIFFCILSDNFPLPYPVIGTICSAEFLSWFELLLFFFVGFFSFFFINFFACFFLHFFSLLNLEFLFVCLLVCVNVYVCVCGVCKCVLLLLLLCLCCLFF